MIRTFWKISLFAEHYSNSYSRWHRAILETPCYKFSEKIRYYNRTRESFCYQSVLCKVFEKFLENCTRYETELYKDEIEEIKKYLRYWEY